MMTILLSTLFAYMPTVNAKDIAMEVTIIRGMPGGTKAKGEIEVLSRPQIVTRDGQQAVIQVGQYVPIVTDVKQQPGKKIVTITNEHTGITLKVIPKIQEDGTIFLSGNINLKEAVSESSTLERSLTFHESVHQDRTAMVPFYNPNELTKPYTGKETWVEIKVVDPKTWSKAEDSIPRAFPDLTIRPTKP